MKKFTALAVAAMLSIGTAAYANSKTDWDNLTPAQQRAVEKSALADNAKTNPNCTSCHRGSIAGQNYNGYYNNSGDWVSTD